MAGWDKKWIYVVTDIVEKDHVDWKGRVKEYVTMPWMNKKIVKSMTEDPESESASEIPGHDKLMKKARDGMAKKAVNARSVSRYVVKKGPITIPPELVLRRCDMLPSRKPGWAEPAVELAGFAKIRARLIRYMLKEGKRDGKDGLMIDPVEGAELYVRLTIDDWKRMDDQERKVERERRDVLEPMEVGGPIDITTNTTIKSRSTTSFGDDYIPSRPGITVLQEEAEWVETEKKRVEGLLRLGDGLGYLESVQAPEQQVLGEYYDV